jgi:hypothetical protein
MVKSRESLQYKLENILGSRNVYFQPPESLKMKYPAIVYSLSNIEHTFANDAVYMNNKSYQLTVIDEDPESEISERVSMLPMCQFNRRFTADNLNHDVFTLFY